MTELSEYIDRIDPSLTIGQVSWYRVGEGSSIRRDDFCDLLRAAGLDPDIAPPAPRDADIFKRACTNAQRTRVPTSDPNTFLNLLSRRVGHDASNIWRRLVCETVDYSGHRLAYTEVFEFHYDRMTSKITTTSLAPSDPVTEGAAAGVQAYFDAEQGKLTPYTVREWVRGQLRNLQATVLRDGVYFVPLIKREAMEQLEQVVNGVNGALFHSLPLIDDRKQREMLRQAFEDESVFEVDRLLGEIREIMDSEGQITSERYAHYRVAFDQIRTKVADYADMLDLALSETASRMEIVHDIMFNLVTHVKID